MVVKQRGALLRSFYPKHAFHSPAVPTMACFVLCCFWVQLPTFCGSRGYSSRVGAPSDVHVTGAGAVHGYDQPGWCYHLCFPGKCAVGRCSLGNCSPKQVPERWFPNKCDIFGASHQIFHVAVMVAAWIHFRGITAAFLAVRSQGVVCSAD